MKYQTGKKEQVIDLLRNNSNKSLSLAEICEKILPDGHGRSTVYRLVSPWLNVALFVAWVTERPDT